MENKINCLLNKVKTGNLDNI